MSPAGILPGGGVEVGENIRRCAAARTGGGGADRAAGEPVLHGLFFNSHVSRRDHVAVYVVRHFRQDRLPEPNREIVACGFFAAAALPAETTEGTRLRIAEVLEGQRADRDLALEALRAYARTLFARMPTKLRLENVHICGLAAWYAC